MMTQVVEIIIMAYKDPFIMQGNLRGCQCPGEVSSQGATAAIVLILTLEPIRFSTRGGFNSWIGNIIDNSWRGSHIFVKIYILHWSGDVILAGFWLLAALRGVILTPFGAASDGNLVGVKTFQFQCFAITLKMLDYCYYSLMRLWVYFCTAISAMSLMGARGCLGFGREEIDTLVPCVTVRGMSMRKGYE